MSFTISLHALFWKEIRTEWRSVETLLSMVTFAGVLSVLFSFALGPGEEVRGGLFPGILWISFFFAGNLGLTASFATEQEDGRLWGLLLAPIPRGSIFLAKWLSNALLMFAVELMVVPLFTAIFDFTWEGSLGLFLAVLALGTVGYAAVGTSVACLVAGTGRGQLLAPIISFPLLMPLILGCVEGMAAALGGAPSSDAGSWLRLLGVFDLVFLVLPYLFLDYLMEV